MSLHIKIKPVAGVKCPHPAPRKAFVRDTGETVEYSHYWQRRIDAGDVELIKDVVVDVQSEKPKPTKDAI